MIATNSRYAANTVIVANDLNGNDIQAIVLGEPINVSFNFSFYQMKQFDNLPDMAFSNYGDPTLWWVIANANPEILLWDAVTPGTIVRVPVSANGS